MSATGEAIRQAIFDEPDELDHRLIYADWLDDHGTALDAARAELIRVQIALETADPDGDAYWTLRARERWLLARWNKGLAGPLRKLVRRYRFRHGFVEWIEADEGQFRRIDDIRRHAIVRGVRPFGVGLWEDWSSCADLTELDLSQVSLGGTVDFIRSMHRMKRLHSLTITAPISLRAVPDTIRRLTARTIPGGECLARLDALTLTSVMEQARFASLSRNPAAANLRELELSAGWMAVIGPPGPHLNNLRSLQINLNSNDFLGREFVEMLVDLGMTNLRELSIRSGHIYEDALQWLVRAPVWPQLHTLELRMLDPIGDRTLEALTAGPILPGLRRLVLPQVAPQALARMARGQTPLIPGEDRDLGQGPGRLAELVAHPGVGPERVLFQLATSRYLDGLTTLELPGMWPIEAEGYHPLLFPKLSWLDLSGRPLSPNWVANLLRCYGPGFRHGFHIHPPSPELELLEDEIPF